MAKNPQMTTSDLRTWTSKTVKECEPTELIALIRDCVTLYYGVYHSNIPDILLTESALSIVTKFNDLTKEEIKHSFSRLPLEKKITLALSDVLDPIQKYYNVKHFISNEAFRDQAEQQQKALSDESELRFKQESIDIYKKSVDIGEWVGDMYNANAIAKEHIAQHFEQEEKKDIWERAKIEYAVRIDDLDTFHLSTGITPTRIFSENLVRLAIERNIQIC